MKISFNPSNSNKNILDLIKNNKDIIFDLKGHSIFARGVEFKGTDTNTWRDIKINNVSIGSHTLDLRNGSNTTLTNTNGIVTINSTWRPVVDNLTSDSTTSSLSAKQGKVLKALIDGKSNSDHNHDGRYLRLSGQDTMQGNLYLHSYGPSYIGKGLGDKSGADFTEANIVIRSWWGISFKSYDDIVRTYIDTRTGNIGTKGVLNAVGAVIQGRVYNGGDDEGIIINPASNGQAGLILGTHNGERSVFYLKKGNPFWRYNNGSTNLDIYHPKKSGTIALTSDIPDKDSWNYDDRYLRLTGGWMSGNIHFKVDNSYDIGSDAAASRYIYTHWLGAKSGSKLELGANNSRYGQGLCIDTNLNVGIGTVSPTQKLDVIGNIRATGQLYLPTNGNYNAILMGDDCWIGDCNISNVIGLSGTNNANSGGIKFGKGGMYIGYNGSSHYSSGTSLWTNFNADTVDGEHASNFSYTHQSSFDFSKRKSGRIVTFDQSGTDYGWINGFASTHNNYLTSVIFNTHRTSDWYVGYMEGDMSTGETKGLRAVHRLALADGDESHPIFLGYLNLYNGGDGTISSSFPCLGYSVPFTYTRGGNYCKIVIPDTTHQVFYIRAATASVHYSGGGMDTWTGYHRGSGAWWLHCYAVGPNEVRVKGFCQADKNNDSWWGGNPLWNNEYGANRITVCIFGYVKFR